jgi:hypothetical protein
MTITVDCFLLLFDTIEHIKGTEFYPKLSLFPTRLLGLSAKKKAVVDVTLLNLAKLHCTAVVRAITLDIISIVSCPLSLKSFRVTNVQV